LGRPTTESVGQQQKRITQLREEVSGFGQKEEGILARFGERREMREVQRIGLWSTKERRALIGTGSVVANGGWKKTRLIRMHNDCGYV
jgi:hypothetical protein